ncbi:MFS transporter [Conexibacter stalactiti]|uniref:MFS transporter n=1 Tax=Conexibacter stalactiti TaxID=1940611 RepID=A0ABU4I0W4_9ACTN|nr:MFS transporter [Conexibacter stalactiti]MDW5598385.1 MFS transporter [Conexibacter stalactiti]MEC5039027.1 MFS transporter [Conexibacter stalactiti]
MTTTSRAGPPESAWAPLRHPVFRAMWSAQFASNVGGWMQTVGAQWLMLSLTSSAAYLAFIQTAASLPVLLLAIPAGAVGDLVDRRRLLLGSELFMLLAALALGLLALAGLVTPWILLAAIFLVGAGQAWTSPTWQTLQPELVSEAERPRAIALGAVNMNLARAVGPALGGLLVAATQPSVVFLVNAATFLVVIVVVWRWKERRGVVAGAGTPHAPLPRESIREAMRASGRYVVASPALRTVLLRAALFVLFASAIWALLPAVADDGLGLGSGGYGLLLGCVGAGAVGGATLLPRLRARLSADWILAAGSLAVAVTALVMATVDSTAAVAAALVLAGVGWIAVLATLSSGFQTMLPAWAKARGMAVYLVVFQGGMAIGSALVGIAAAASGVDAVLLVAAVALAAGPLVALRAPFPRIEAAELTPACDWPLPSLAGADAAGRAAAGPVLVTVEYRAAAGQADALLAALAGVRRARRRTGAISWRIWRDAAAPERVLEQFVVGSWDEHLRQHARFTTRDQARLDAVRALTDPATPPLVTHWTSA